MPVDSLGATLPYDVLLIIHSFLPSVYGDSVRLDQIAHFRFAAISSVHRDAAFANGAYQVRFDRLSGFLALLKASSKLATGMKRLDLWCMTGRFDSLNGDRISNPAWRDMAEILGLAKNLQFLEIALGVNVIAGFPEVKVWKDHIEVSKQLEKLTELREFCFLSGWNAFDYKVVELLPLWKKLERLSLVGATLETKHFGNVTRFNPVPSERQMLSTFPRLHTLRIPLETPGSIPFFQRFSLVPSIIHLHIIAQPTMSSGLWPFTPLDVAAETDVLQSMAPRLKPLQIVLRKDWARALPSDLWARSLRSRNARISALTTPSSKESPISRPSSTSTDSLFSPPATSYDCELASPDHYRAQITEVADLVEAAGLGFYVIVVGERD